MEEKNGVKGNLKIAGKNSKIGIRSYGTYVDGKELKDLIYEQLKHLNTADGYDDINFIGDIELSINVKPNSLKLENTMELVEDKEGEE